jgi:hypothetical protein
MNITADEKEAMKKLDNELFSLQNDWVKVNDEDILHVWINDETKEEVSVSPDFYETNGEPCDEDGNVLSYSHTIIRK